MDQNRLFADLAYGLPAEVERYYRGGDFAAANARIDRLLQAERLPAPAKNALLACREIMRRIPDNYTLDRAAALAALREQIPDFTEQEFDALVQADRIDWRYLNGTPYYLDRFVSALALYPDLQARGLQAPPADTARDEMIARMRRNGSAAARITVRAAVAPPEGTDPAAEFEAWLPFPAACAQQSDIELLDAAPGYELAPADAPQRTIHWRGGAGEKFVTYRYRIRADDLDMNSLTPAADQSGAGDPDGPTAQDLAEQSPHIRFTPWLRALCARLTAGCTGPLEKAKAIYDYVTRNTNYRYQPAYVCLEDIAENCARSGWGDCGVMALLFIALCRMAGVPARWQSGLYVTPDEIGAHDWAQFYVAPYGWLWADCSFGSGANRVGCEERRQHYFGNLDPLRMVANRAFYAPLTPPDPCFRNDPYDNQTGEAVLNGRPLHGEQLVREQTVLSFEVEA